MEKEGLRRAINSLLERGISIQATSPIDIGR